MSSIVGGSFVMWQQPIEVEIEDAVARPGGGRGGGGGGAASAAVSSKRINNHAHDFLLRYKLLGADYGGSGDGGLYVTELPLVAIVDPRTNELVQVRTSQGQ